MLHDALANFECKIQAAEGGITLLEIFHDAQGMKVVVEGQSVLVHRSVERLFSGMAEGRVPDIVHQRERFRKICIQAQCSGDSPRDLSDLESMSQPIAEMIGVAAGEKPGLCFQAAESASVNHAISVALKIVAVGVRRLWKAASARLRYLHRIGRQHGARIALLIGDGCRSRRYGERLQYGAHGGNYEGWVLVYWLRGCGC